VIDPFYCCSSTSLDTIVIQRRGIKKICIIYRNQVEFLRPQQLKLVDQSDLIDVRHCAECDNLSFRNYVS